MKSKLGLVSIGPRASLVAVVLLAITLAGFASPAGASTNIANAALDFYFPTNGSTFEAGEGYQNDVAAIQTVLVDKCLESAGFQGVPYALQQYVGDNEEFPNLPYLRAHGFLGVATQTPDPTQGMSASEAKAYNQQAAVCSEKATATFTPVTALGSTLQSEWMRKVAEIDEGRAFRKALKGFTSCTAKSGIDITSINGFFNYMGTQMNASGHSPAMSLHFAAIYATCLGPAETLRDDLRAQDRQTFFSTNAEQIDQLTSKINSIVKVLGHKYRIKWQAN
jgi:hypothetical protein